jgi:hypothetical protein
MVRDLPEALAPLEESLAVARRAGRHAEESLSAANVAYVQFLTGYWEGVERLGDELFAQGDDRPFGAYMHERMLDLAMARGNRAGAQRALAGMETWRDSEDQELADGYALAHASSVLANGDAAGAQPELERLARYYATAYGNGENLRGAWPATMDAALALGNLDLADELMELLEQIPPGVIAPYLRAQLSRNKARVAAARGEHEMVEQHFQAAVDTLGALGYPYWGAVARADFAHWLAGQSRSEQARELLADAVDVLASLRAEPELRRAQAILDGAELVRSS